MITFVLLACLLIVLVRPGIVLVLILLVALAATDAEEDGEAAQAPPVSATGR